MELTRALAADLRDLAVDLGAGAYTRETLTLLQRSLRRQVPAALGAAITMSHADVSDSPVGINLFLRPVAPAEIVSAVQFPLEIVGVPVSGAVAFYASTPTAFVELVADIAAALGVDQSSFDQHPELPHCVVHPGVTGLMDFSIVNRAVGVLINRGHSVAGARAELQRRADRSRTNLPTTAQTLLDTII